MILETIAPIGDDPVVLGLLNAMADLYAHIGAPR
jgi:hypothetical protein